MKSDDALLQVEITIVPAKGRRGNQRPGERAGPTKPEPQRIPRLTRLMALAIKFQDMVDRGEVQDYADLARLGYVSRARITQIMNLLNLAPQIQEALLFPQSGPIDCSPTCEHRIRTVSRLVLWTDQNDSFHSAPATAILPA